MCIFRVNSPQANWDFTHWNQRSRLCLKHSFAFSKCGQYRHRMVTLMMVCLGDLSWIQSSCYLWTSFGLGRVKCAKIQIWARTWDREGWARGVGEQRRCCDPPRVRRWESVERVVPPRVRPASPARVCGCLSLSRDVLFPWGTPRSISVSRSYFLWKAYLFLFSLKDIYLFVPESRPTLARPWEGIGQKRQRLWHLGVAFLCSLHFSYKQ